MKTSITLNSYCDFVHETHQKDYVCVDSFCYSEKNIKYANWIKSLREQVMNANQDQGIIKNFPETFTFDKKLNMEGVDNFFQTFTSHSVFKKSRNFFGSNSDSFEFWLPQGKEWMLKDNEFEVNPKFHVSYIEYIRLLELNHEKLFIWAWRTGFIFVLKERQQFTAPSVIIEKLEIATAATGDHVQHEAVECFRKGLFAGFSAGMKEKLVAKSIQFDSNEKNVGIQTEVEVLKILLACREHFGINAGGIARHVENLGNSLARLGHDVTIFGGAPFSAEANFSPNIEYVCSSDFIDEETPSNLPDPVATFAKNLSKFAANRSYNGIIVPNFEGTGIEVSNELPVLVSWHTTTKQVLSTWGQAGLYLKKSIYMSKVIRAEENSTLKHPFIISNSSSSTAVAKRIAEPGSLTIWQIPHGIPDEDSIEYISRDFKSRRSAILFVARGDLRKNFDLAVRVWLEASKKVNIDLLVVGPDPDQIYTKTLKEYSRLIRASRNSVHLLGILSKNELLEIYKDVRLTIVTSHYESFGLTVIEALRAGTPVISSGKGGLQDFESVEGVFTVKEAEVSQYVETILNLSNARNWNAASQSARESFKQKFTSEAMALKHVEAIRIRSGIQLG